MKYLEYTAILLFTIGSWKFGLVKDEFQDNYSLAFGDV